MKCAFSLPQDLAAISGSIRLISAYHAFYYSTNQTRFHGKQKQSAIHLFTNNRTNTG